MKRAGFLLIFFAALTACSGSKSDEAVAICNCYGELPYMHEKVRNAAMDSCNELFTETISSLTPEEEKTFYEVYYDCN